MYGVQNKVWCAEKFQIIFNRLKQLRGKRYVISFLFQQKLTYENGNYQTLLRNEISAIYIYNENKELGSKKKAKDF